MTKKKLGRPLKLNPIAEKLIKISRDTDLSKEMICVKIDVCYPTFNNIFARNRVSKMMLLALQMADIIDKDDIYAYQVWLNKSQDSRTKPKE